MPRASRNPNVGEIWLTDFGPAFPHEPAGLRPAVVMGPIIGKPHRLPFVFVVPLTTRERKLCNHVDVGSRPESGLPKRSFAQPELLRSVSIARCTDHLGLIDADSWNSIREVTRRLLGF